MPTPVSTARQCLTPESAQALNEAVLVARRRGHAQTTSLHLVSALLSLPSSSALREACARTRNTAYSSRIQFKALELCLGVSLDRLPSSPQRVEEPHVSNSLMAAIKRSQANQRRQPENFQFYQHQQLQSSSSSSISMVKVELRNLILSILDDPVVSRVFGEAGFRSCDIKLAILRPVHHLFRYSRYKGPPVFLCNLSGDSNLGGRSFSFPFLGFSGFFDSGDSCHRIGEILAREKGRNPLLVGECVNDALRNFIETVERRTGRGILPLELAGLSVITVHNEILKFLSDNSDEGLLKSSFEEVGRMVEHCIGPGVVVNFGDLEPLISDDYSSSNSVSHIVKELARLLELHGRKVWLIGATTKYETYLKLLNRFPSIEKDWDLQLLSITSPREPYPRSSLMESFVPLGGFFSTPSEIKGPLKQHSYQCALRCQLCNEKFEQEVTALSNGVITSSVADHYQSSLPSWLQMAELNTDHGLDAVKAKDDNSMVMSAKVAVLEKKWDSICQRIHYSRSIHHKVNACQPGSEVPAVVGSQVIEQGKKIVDNHNNNNNNTCSNESGSRATKSSMAMDVVSKSANMDFLAKLHEKPSKTEGLGSFRSPHSLSISSACDGHTSPTSATSVTTDLGLGINSFSISRPAEKSTQHQRNINLAQDFSGCFSANVDVVTESISNHPAQSSSCSCSEFQAHFDKKDYKMLYTALAKRVSWQQEAARVISQTIARCRTRNEKRHGVSRGDIWFNFLGPDRFGKKKIAISIAEILYESRENFVCVDLSLQDGMIHATTVTEPQSINDYNMKFRGKTVVDYIADELTKKPPSVVVLENIDKADLLVQHSLTRALRTGRFADSRGREVGISNAIFVSTSSFMGDSKVLNDREGITLPDKCWPIQLLIGFDLGDNAMSHDSQVLNPSARKGSSNAVFINKRKLIGTNETVEDQKTNEMAKRAHKGTSNPYLDLNLPANESQLCDTDCGSSDSESLSETSSKAWLEDFLKQADETVVFKPFDSDALADKILNAIADCFYSNGGSECLLEIDPKVMEQIVAAAYWSNISKVEDWIQQVLRRGFVEAQDRYNLTARSVVKLVACQGLLPLEQTTPGGMFLPARIILN